VTAESAQTATEAAALLELDGAVAVVTLNRPDRGNAWTRQMQDDYFAALDRCAEDTDVRAIVVTGAGRSFCVGADMDLLAGVVESGASASTSAAATKPHTYATSLPKPVIAAINGACAGLGLVHALMCDVRFAAAGAKFTTAFARRGLVAEHGISWLLPRLVGPANALDLLLSGRIFLAEEAAELGVVNKVLPPEDVLPQALEYAHELATWSSPRSMAAMKRQVYAHLDLGLDEALAETNELMRQSFEWGDLAEGVASYTEKREPRFAPYTSA
jgi:enoyl-CoA hydratase/carnithine racemase